MNTQTGFLKVENGEIYYEVAGAGEAVVLIHGLSLDTRMWDDQFAVLAEQYQAVRFDLRGSGRSPAPTGEYARVDDIQALLQFVGAPKAHIIGLSMGGGIAIDFALMYPQLTRSLIVIDSALGGYPYTTDFGEDPKAIGLEKAKANWLSHDFFVPANRNPAVAVRLRQMVNDWSGWEWLNHDPGRVPNPLPYYRLKEISVPTLVMVGELDIPDFQGIAEQLAREIPGARKVVIPGAGHMANMEAPEAVNAAIFDFLGSVKI